jgi:DNA-binding CsgD family transcriptional regulator
MIAKPGDKGGSQAEPGLVALKVELGEEELIVVSMPARPSSLTDVRLTPAERAVASAALEGLSTVEIARRRKSSPRTVVNQLAAVYRKLGVSSRAELAARWSDVED